MNCKNNCLYCNMNCKNKLEENLETQFLIHTNFLTMMSLSLF